jgi:rhodanese-related sulfurtransferase
MHPMIVRHAKAPLIFTIYAATVLGQEGQPAPWSRGELMQASSLAQLIKSSTTPATIISVVYPVLYRQRHILHARFAGPGNKEEGIEALRQAVQSLPKTSQIVIYCGCCPMEKCPNLRPAYQALKKLGFTKIRVLDLPTNFHTDWAEKGYPVE